MKFTKMQGCGNDYVYVDAEAEGMPPGDYGQLAKRISDRHFGVGSDGLILLRGGKKADFEMEMYNADGSRGKTCGNGLRCLAKFIRDRGLTQAEKFSIESMGILAEVEVLEESGESVRPESRIRVDMGIPCFEVPEREVEGFRVFCVSMGNPHAVVLLDETVDPQNPFSSLAGYVNTAGPLIERAECFPDRTNVEFVQVLGRGCVCMRVWERGSGETLACGSGACAAAAVCMQKGLTDEEITVKLLGGELLISREGAEGRTFLTGPAVTVFEGVYLGDSRA